MDNKLAILRRLYVIDNLVNFKLDKYDNSIATKMEFGLCDESDEYFYGIISQWVIEQMYYNHFGNIDDSSEEWKELYNVMEKYINTLHGKTIRDFFNDICGSK